MNWFSQKNAERKRVDLYKRAILVMRKNEKKNEKVAPAGKQYRGNRT